MAPITETTINRPSATPSASPMASPTVLWATRQDTTNQPPARTTSVATIRTATRRSELIIGVAPPSLGAGPLPEDPHRRPVVDQAPHRPGVTGQQVHATVRPDRPIVEVRRRRVEADAAHELLPVRHPDLVRVGPFPDVAEEDPVRVTVGPKTTAPSRTTQTVCWVRSTQAVRPAPAPHLACSAAVRLTAIRRATLAVVAPALPLAGLMPKRCWNFLIAAQSAADWRPSTVTGPYAPIWASAVSTSSCRSPCGQSLFGFFDGFADGVDAGGGAAGVVGVAVSGAAGVSEPEDASAPVVPAAATGSGAGAEPVRAGPNALAPAPTNITVAAMPINAPIRSKRRSVIVPPAAVVDKDAPKVPSGCTNPISRPLSRRF